jgi:hypothetical protein
MGKIRIQNLDRLDETKAAPSGVRETIVWILFCLILAAGVFGWGIVYENRRLECFHQEIHKLDLRQKDMNGRLIAVEGKRK